MHWLNYIVGSSDELSSENRTLNLVAVIAIGVTLTSIISNAIIGLHHLNFSLFISFVVLSVIYYLARFQRRFQLARIVMITMAYLILGVSFFQNNGTDGSVVIASIAILFLALSITKAKNQFVAVLLHILLFLGLMAVEYNYPELIPDNYPTRLERQIDIASGFVITIVFLSFLLMFIRRMMNEQKQKIEEQREALERTNVQLRRIFSVLSHDLRTPLNNIQSYLEILQDGSLSDDEEKGIKAQLLKSTKNSTAMLTPILEWSKLELKGETMRDEETEVDALIHTCLQQVSDYADEKGVLLEYTPCNHRVSCAPDQMVVILRNLMHNAIKFSESGQKVEVYCREIDGQCTVCVKDSGRGMTPEEVDRLFTVESRSKKGTNSEVGSGIGLILSKQLAALNKADLEVESSPGIGTIMMVKFKANDVTSDHSLKSQSVLN